MSQGSRAVKWYSGGVEMQRSQGGAEEEEGEGGTDHLVQEMD